MCLHALTLLSLASLIAAVPQLEPSTSTVNKRYLEERNGITYNVFKRAGDTSTLLYIKNSGICETTPGVDQYSGYLDVDDDFHMFYWLFSSRNDPVKDPLVIWLQGDMGCSSMLGLFEENGPCHFVDGNTEPSLNNYSWNANANMLYVDQPVGAGFSFSSQGIFINNTVEAAEYVWKFLQVFFAAFPNYESREFGLWTESYGGHFGPQFSSFFQSKNAEIDAGKITGEKINLVALGINNGWIDPLLQYKSYPSYAYNNPYKPLITKEEYEKLADKYINECLPDIELCTPDPSTDDACVNAEETCFLAVVRPIQEPIDFNPSYIKETRTEYLARSNPDFWYLRRRDIMTAIGAQKVFEDCSAESSSAIVFGADYARSYLEPLSKVIQSGINVVIWVGLLDWERNADGIDLVVDAINYTHSAELKSAKFAEYTVNGKSHGQFKTAGNLNYLKVYEAGQNVAFYQPATASQVFMQIMRGEPLSST